MELEPRWRVILYRQPLVSLEFVGDPPICRKFIDTIQGTNNSEALRFKRTAFYNGLKSKIGLAAAKTAALRVNLNVQGCGIVAPPMHAPSRTPLLLSLLLSHNLPTPRVH